MTDLECSRNRLLPALLVGVAVSALAGCASVPKLGPAPQPHAAGDYAAKVSLTAPAAEWPGDGWWTAYGDPGLNALMDEALAGSPDLAVAQARVRQAEALAERTGALLAPQVGLEASVTQAKQSYNNGIPSAFVPHGWHDAGRVGIDFAWQLDLFGKNRAMLAAATSQAEATRVEAAAARLDLSAAIAGAWADLAELHADRDAVARALDVRRQTEALIVERVAQGLENAAAAERARSGRAATESELAAIDEAIGLTHNRLAALAGQGPDRGLAIGRPSVSAIRAFGLPDQVQADLIGRRPDIVAARLTAEAAAQRIKAARADFYPNVNLVAFAGGQSLGLDLLGRSGSATGQIGPAVSLPIFDGGNLRGAFKGARADYDAAVANYDATLTRALNEVADAATQSKALSVRQARTTEAADAARAAWRMVSDRYRGGLATYLEVLAAEDAMISAERAEADLGTRAFALDISLIHALGGGFHAAGSGV